MVCALSYRFEIPENDTQYSKAVISQEQRTVPTNQTRISLII